jgi:glycosyltransferase involved in cell wall biosynthesis
LGVIGVTSEIAHFQVDTRAPGKPAGLYANGIALDAVDLVDDRRSAQAVNIVFMSNTFSAWHGLDRLVDAVRDAPSIPDNLVFHIIGHLSQLQNRQISALGLRANLFRVYGFLEEDAYRQLLSTADVGLGSLAMDRQNLTEGATLKVREMLGMGLAIYSGHVDTSLPLDFPFYRKVKFLDIADLVLFARSMKQFSRLEIRQSSAPFIEKFATMKVASDWLRLLFIDGTPN